MKKIFLLLIVAIAAVMMTSCDESWVNPPTQNGEYTKTPDSFIGQEATVRPKDSIVVVTKDSTITKFINDTIYTTDTTVITIVTTEHDTITVPVGADTVYQDWVNKYSFGYEPSILRGDIYYDVENDTWMDVEKKEEKNHFETQTTLGIRVRRATADTLFLKKMGKSIKYLTPSYENNLTYDSKTFKGGVVSRTERDVRLRMNDSYETVVPQYYEEAFVTDEGVLRQLPSFRITSTEYLSHEDHVIVDDTIVKDGMVYNAIRRDAKIAAHVVVFPQVGEAYEETVILKSDNTMDELKQKIYVEDHPYVEPTPTPEDTVPVNPDTIPTPPTPPTPDEPGYPFQGGKVKAAYFTWAVDMNNRIHEAILIVTENTLVPIVDTDYQMVSGTRYVYNPSEVTVNDDMSAYNSVSYNGGVVPAVLSSYNGGLYWNFNGSPVCAMEDASLASLARNQSTTLTSTKVQDLSRKCTFKNVGNTTHIQTPFYTVVISR
jgi:hypothetical protein